MNSFPGERSITRALRMPRIDPELPTFHGPSDAASERNSTEVLSSACKADILRDDLTGLRLRQYVLGRKVGAGGMGTVFLARHIQLDRVFAIKFMATDHAEQTQLQNRFEREIKALGQLQHPQILNAVDAGCCNGLKYLVTELIEGEDLAQRVRRRGPLPVPEACEQIRQVALGLAYAHARGFVHRDIKPSNLIVDPMGAVKILDFGLVCHTRQNHELTNRQDQLGTWDFVAPEQARDASQVDHRSDLYSLGCTLLFLLSGNVPFASTRYETSAAKLTGHYFDVPEWLGNPPADIPLELINILTRMLAKSPSQRFQSASEIAAVLAPFTNLNDHAITTSDHSDRMKVDEFIRPPIRHGAFAFSFMILLGWLAFVLVYRSGLTVPAGTTIQPVELHRSATRIDLNQSQ